MLAENIRTHVKEEESEMLPRARKMEMDFEQLGRQMKMRKEQLMSQGVPTTKEERMVSSSAMAPPA